MEELLKILNEVKPGVDYENETDLIGHGMYGFYHDGYAGASAQ